MIIDNHNLSKFYMILSSVFYSIQYFDLKLLTKNYNIWIIIFIRAILGIIICQFILFIKIIRSANSIGILRTYLGVKIYSLLLRGILGCCASIGLFIGINNLNLSLAVIIISTVPLWTGFLSYIFKKRNWKLINTISSIICILGIFFIIFKEHHNKSNDFLIGFVFSIISSIFSALVNVTIDQIKDEDTFVINLYYNLFLSLVSLVYILIKKLNFTILLGLNYIRIIELFGISILFFFAQYFKTKALQINDNLNIIVLRYLDPIFTIMLDILLLHTTLSIYEIIGICFILLGCFINYLA